VLKLLIRVRGRLLLNELLSQGATTVCAALVAVIVLLLAGAQALDWRWLLPLPVVTAAIGIWRARKRLPRPYTTAQLLDRRLDLADTLSTAFYFSQRDADAPAARHLLERANRLSQSLDFRKATPYTIPRAAYPMLALVLVASGLFALRYAISGKLDWNAPMAQLLQWNPFAPDRALARDLAHRDPDIKRAESEVADSAQAGDASREHATDPAGKNAEDSASGRAGKSAPSDGKDSSAAGQQQAQSADKGEGRQQAESADPSAGQTEEASSRNNPGERSSQAGVQQSRSDSQGFMDRFKDAVQSLFSRSGQAAREESSPDSAGRNGQPSASQAAAKQRDSAEKQAGAGQGSANRGEADRSADSAQAGQSGNAAGNSDAASKQPGNGIGSENGDKAIKQAEQLAAMGKISEIFGKRAANLTGQATVEVQSATQQLRTPYEQRSGTHSDAGAEIGRDEVPPALQAYVREYFAQVRKQRKK
jgi:hypothetical protein